MQGYHHNHYVPISYQRRFMLAGQEKYYRLDLKPQTVFNGSVKYTRKAQHHWGPDSIFAEDDLYTTKWGAGDNTDIERFFFGQRDDEGVPAIDFIRDFDHEDQNYNAPLFNAFVRYMSVQKLRTPKGLEAFAAQSNTKDKNETLILLQQMQDMYCATWTDCIWQVADASESPAKFIISDHPVTVYNRACPHLSKYCVAANDPDIRMNATHTYFPLSLDKILIMTNLSWVRDPYQNEVKFRPNSKLFRETVFNFLAVQVGRKLTEDEVLQINLITKRRAYRYIAAAEEDWLYPERTVSTDYWKKFGDGYLLMPEPRLIHMGGEIVIGYEGGGGQSFSPYGHTRGQPGFKDEKRERRETDALRKFKAEWAVKHGAKYKAYNNDFGGKLREDSAEMMADRKRVYEETRKQR
jgi:Protein of unknown function (DUF4238)